MILKLLSVIGGTVAAGGLALTGFARRKPAELRDRRLDERETVDLNGLGAVSLPPTFRFDGLAGSPPALRLSRAAASADEPEDLQVSLRFVQGQFRRMGGHTVSPVVLAITLFDPSTDSDPLPPVTDTPIAELGASCDAGSFRQLRWKIEHRGEDAITRSCAVSDRTAPRAPRWLVIHTDANRRVRVDLYAWQSAYTLPEARSLVESVARSTVTGPALRSYFEAISAVDRRMHTLRRAVLAAAVAQLRPFGIRSIVPGEVTLGHRCAVSLSANVRFLCVARFLGSVPLTAAEMDERGRPKFAFVHSARGYPGCGLIDGHPDLQLRMFYWDAAASAWKMSGLQGALYEPSGFGRDMITPAIVGALEARDPLARSSAYVWDYAFYDLQSRPQAVDVAKFLVRAERYASELKGGRIVARPAASARA